MEKAWQCYLKEVDPEKLRIDFACWLKRTEQKSNPFYRDVSSRLESDGFENRVVNHSFKEFLAEYFGIKGELYRKQFKAELNFEVMGSAEEGFRLRKEGADFDFSV